MGISYAVQSRGLTEIRAALPEIARVPVVVLRGVLRRLDSAWVAYVRGQRGRPRFRSLRRWHSFGVDDVSMFKPLQEGSLRLPVVGLVKTRLHRPVEGNPKAVRVKKDSQGRWWVTFLCVDVPRKVQEPTGRSAGLDLGIANLVATSDGKIFPNLKALASAEAELRRAARRVGRRRPGSRRRRKAVRILARKHERVRNLRREHHIQIAKELVGSYDQLFVEALNVKALSRSKLAKSVHDAAWGGLLHWLRTKAEEAGCEVVEVDPRGTSQECPACGRVEKKSLSQRRHVCRCGFEADRDVAAALVIQGRGARLRREGPVGRSSETRGVRVV